MLGTNAGRKHRVGDGDGQGFDAAGGFVSTGRLWIPTRRFGVPAGRFRIPRGNIAISAREYGPAGDFKLSRVAIPARHDSILRPIFRGDGCLRDSVATASREHVDPGK